VRWPLAIIGCNAILLAIVFVIIGDQPGPAYNGFFVFLFWVGVVGGGYMIRESCRLR